MRTIIDSATQIYDRFGKAFARANALYFNASLRFAQIACDWGIPDQSYATRAVVALIGATAAIWRLPRKGAV